MRRRFWIPPIPLAAGIAFQFLAWCLVLFHAVSPSFGIELAWVHAVALGWLTVVALAVLIHVVPGFTDLRWRGEGVARVTVLVVCVAAFVLVVSFAASTPIGVAFAGTVLAAAIVLYATLALTALLGGQLSLGYAWSDARLLAAAPSHAVLGIAAWLTVLTTGVSSRTFRPMLGTQSRWPKAHVITGAALFVGSVLAAAAAPWSPMLVRAGLLVGSVGVLAYIVDAADILRRAPSPHRAARAFVSASPTCTISASESFRHTSWVTTTRHGRGLSSVLSGAGRPSSPPKSPWFARRCDRWERPRPLRRWDGSAGLLCMLAIVTNAVGAARRARTLKQRATV